MVDVFLRRRGLWLLLMGWAPSLTRRGQKAICRRNSNSSSVPVLTFMLGSTIQGWAQACSPSPGPAYRGHGTGIPDGPSRMAGALAHLHTGLTSTAARPPLYPSPAAAPPPPPNHLSAGAAFCAQGCVPRPGGVCSDRPVPYVVGVGARVMGSE
eukprot:205663-Chlamydomonas_euryale.AAC.4